MSDWQRTARVSLLLGLAAVCGVIGATLAQDERTAWPWFTTAVVLLVAGLVWVSGSSERVSWVTQVRRWLQRRDLSHPERRGWAAFPTHSAAGTVLHLVRATGAPNLRGFLCEVHGPTGTYFAYTFEVEKMQPRASELLPSPWVGPATSLMFPQDFKTVLGEGLPAAPFMPTGWYHVFWWAFEMDESDKHVRRIFVDGHSFKYTPTGLEKHRSIPKLGR